MSKDVWIGVNKSQSIMDVANQIHEQLKGNEDYIESRIVLSVDEDFNRCSYFCGDDVKNVPKITIEI